MSDARMWFLPWMRRGLARAVAEPAVDGLPTRDQATITASVSLDGEQVSRALAVRGPGEVTGIAASQIVRQEPPDGTTDFEPNYFPAVELLTPDLPWMFTPAAPASNKLVPWFVLVVVRDGVEGITLRQRPGGATPVLTISAPAAASAELPDLAEAWAWAHVQAATEVSAGRSTADAFAEQPEAFVARLLCPRRLDERTWYRACLVPTFEAGRRAGLGLSTEGAGVALAWSTTTTAVELPVYTSWRFHTGPDGDFEALVRRLVPRELDCGLHDLDLGGAVVSYAGALVAPAAQRRVWNPRHREPFQRALRARLDEQLGRALDRPAGDPAPYDPLRDDPVVAPPVYGALPTGATAVGPRPAWLEDVNLDPVARSAAGLGADVVRRDQEALMASAWSQAESLREINRMLSWTRLAVEVGVAQAARHLAPLSDGELVQVAGSARRRVAGSSAGTVAGQLTAAAVPSGLTSGAFRRAARPGGVIGRALRSSLARGLAGRSAGRFTRDLAGAMSFASYVRPTGAQLSDGSMLRSMPGVPASITDGSPISTIAVPVSAGAADAARAVAGALRRGLDVRTTLAAKLANRITAPAEAWDGEAMPRAMTVTPQFGDPLYRALAALDPEYLLPGLGATPDDTAGLVEVNAAFVEAFLLGANHELAHEFLWREYPADLTDTWLTTFWSSLDGSADIGPIAGWRTGALGAHQIGSAARGTLALLLKGTLLRRYPDTSIYAVEAAWDGDVRVERSGGERKDPVFSGKLGRDATFLGFELDRAEARGAVTAAGLPDRSGPAGWFFVFEEPMLGPRFGLDVAKARHAGDLPRWWRNLSWGHLVDDATALPSLSHAPVGGRLLGVERGYDDGLFRETWGSHAAAMARITYQRPTRMLVHASAMLP